MSDAPCWLRHILPRRVCSFLRLLLLLLRHFFTFFAFPPLSFAIYFFIYIEPRS